MVKFVIPIPLNTPDSVLNTEEFMIASFYGQTHDSDTQKYHRSRPAGRIITAYGPSSIFHKNRLVDPQDLTVAICFAHKYNFNT